jgi:hypothetical protein
MIPLVTNFTLPSSVSTTTLLHPPQTESAASDYFVARAHDISNHQVLVHIVALCTLTYVSYLAGVVHLHPIALVITARLVSSGCTSKIQQRCYHDVTKLVPTKQT